MNGRRAAPLALALSATSLGISVYLTQAPQAGPTVAAAATAAEVTPGAEATPVLPALSPRAAARPEPSAEMQRLAALVRELAAGQRDLRTALAELETTVDGTAEMPFDDGDDDELAEPLEPLHEGDTPAALRFDSEGVDGEWHAGAERLLREALEVDALTIDSADCRDTLCRVELRPSHDAAQASGPAPLLSVASRLPWPSESYLHFGDATLDEPTVLYVSRAGYSLDGEWLGLDESP